MSMETFSLLDDAKHSSIRDDLSMYEIYKTRLLRVDLGARSQTDPFQRWFHKHLRAFRYWNLSREYPRNGEDLRTSVRSYRWPYQNTVFLADILGRATTAATTGAFLIIPLVILSQELGKGAQLTVVSVCIVALLALVALGLKVSSFEMIAISAAYAAVLSVFVSNVPEKRA